jgi:hypothetical protein
MTKVSMLLAASKAREEKKKRKEAVLKPLPEFMSPSNPKNTLAPLWWIPSPERLVLLLKQNYGDVKALLNKATKSQKEHERLLFAINERLTSRGNEFCLEEWERLKNLYEITQIERLKQEMLGDVLKMDAAKRKTKLTDVKFLFAKTEPAAKKKETAKEKEAKETNMQIMKELAMLSERMKAPASTEAEEPEDCQVADDSD